VRWLRQWTAAHRVPLEVVRAGDRLRADPSVEVAVQWPTDAGDGGSDNSHSIVLELCWGDRRTLLPGDLEGAGIEALLAVRPAVVDVLMAPHHGSIDSLRPELIDWAKPRWVVVSADRRDWRRLARREAYRSLANVAVTARDGAVLVELSPQQVVVRHWNGGWETLEAAAPTR
jgi:competence protein ComEC